MSPLGDAGSKKAISGQSANHIVAPRPAGLTLVSGRTAGVPCLQGGTNDCTKEEVAAPMTGSTYKSGLKLSNGSVQSCLAFDQLSTSRPLFLAVAALIQKIYVCWLYSKNQSRTIPRTSTDLDVAAGGRSSHKHSTAWRERDW